MPGRLHDCGHQGRVDSFAMEDLRVACMATEGWNRSAKQETGKVYR